MIDFGHFSFDCFDKYTEVGNGYELKAFVAILTIKEAVYERKNI